MNETLKQTVLEVGRLALIGLVSYLATDLVIEGMVEAFAGEQLSAAAKVQITAVVGVIVKAIDRGLHETTYEKGVVHF